MLANSSELLSRIASLLGEDEDAACRKELSRRVSESYRTVFTDRHGNLKKEFQAGEVSRRSSAWRRAQLGGGRCENALWADRGEMVHS